jgi:hypothetical protein
MIENGKHRVSTLELVLAMVAMHSTEVLGLVDNSIIDARRGLSLRIQVT